MQMHRHPCGFYYSQDFADYLEAKQTAEASAHPGELLALDYLRCGEGQQAGAAWWQLDWVPQQALPADNVHMLGTVKAAFSRRTLHGLRGRMLHYSGGQVVIKQ